MTTRELLRTHGVPVYQNKMFDTQAAAENCPRGDIILAQDTSSGLVFNSCFDPSKLSHDQSYQNEQAHSPAFQRHLVEVLGKIDQHFLGERVLEIGCGKGRFLDLMRENGHDAIGVDPAYEGNAPYIIRKHFDETLQVHGDAVVLRHVLEHMPDPVGFLRSIASAKLERGKIYIEVPCLDWIAQRRARFDIFYEHVNYFRLSDFDRIFGTVFESGHLFGGHYIFAVADLATLRTPKLSGAREQFDLPANFMDALDRLASSKTYAATRVAWGAAAKGVMFSHHMTSLGVRMDFVIDMNPAKQGKFLAGSALPVLSPAAALPRLVAGATYS